MKDIFKSMQIFLLFVLISKSGNTQDYKSYQAFDAELLRVNDDTTIESRLKKVVVSLSDNSTQLSVRTTIPFSSMNHLSEDNGMIEAESIVFSLKVNINPWQIQDYLTSAKLFTTEGALTLNNTTKTVMVEYIPFPAGTDLDGDFNLTMLIQFKPGDFGLEVPHRNSKFIIRIGDARAIRI